MKENGVENRRDTVNHLTFDKRLLLDQVEKLERKEGKFSRDTVKAMMAFQGSWNRFKERK